MVDARPFARGRRVLLATLLVVAGLFGFVPAASASPDIFPVTVPLADVQLDFPADASWSDVLVPAPVLAGGGFVQFGAYLQYCSEHTDVCVQDVRANVEGLRDADSGVVGACPITDDPPPVNTRSLLAENAPVTVTAVRAVGIGVGISLGFFYWNYSSVGADRKAVAVALGGAATVVADRILTFLDAKGTFNSGEALFLAAMSAVLGALRQGVSAAASLVAGSCPAAAETELAFRQLPFADDPELGLFNTV